jgi:hypothetical protein
MRVYRIVAVAAVLAGITTTGVAVAATFSGQAQPRVLKVSWNERKSFEHGYMSFHVSKITSSASSWSVTASFTNHSQYTITTIPGTTTGRGSGLSILYYVPPPPGAATGG